MTTTQTRIMCKLGLHRWQVTFRHFHLSRFANGTWRHIHYKCAWCPAKKGGWER